MEKVERQAYWQGEEQKEKGKWSNDILMKK